MKSIPLGGKLVGKSHSRLRPLLCDISNKSCHSQRPEKEIFDVFVKNTCLDNGGFSPVHGTGPGPVPSPYVLQINAA